MVPEEGKVEESENSVIEFRVWIGRKQEERAKKKRKVGELEKNQLGFLLAEPVSGSGFLSGKGIGNYIIMSAVAAVASCGCS